MTATIVYETANGTDSIERDEYHTDTEPLLTAFDSPGAKHKVKIPIERVVRIDE